MSDSRLVNAARVDDDAQYEAGLRPRTLADYIGQDRVRANLEVSIAAARNSAVIAMARFSDGTGTRARHKAPGSGAVRNVTAAITPSVPSDPMKRSTRSIPGAMK